MTGVVAVVGVSLRVRAPGAVRRVNAGDHSSPSACVVAGQGAAANGSLLAGWS